jgi:uncharacterized protein YjbI with pentapeptide repeats
LFYRTKFDSTHLNAAEFRRDTLAEASFSYSNLFRASFYKATLTRTRFNGADLTASVLTDVDAYLVNLDSTLLFNTELVEGNFTRGTMRDAQLDFAELGGANLTAVDLSGASLRAADLRGANLRNIRNWRDIYSLVAANIYGVQNAPDGFARWAVDTMMAVEIASHTAWLDHQRRAFGGAVTDRREGMPSTTYVIAMHCDAYFRNDTLHLPALGSTEGRFQIVFEGGRLQFERMCLPSVNFLPQGALSQEEAIALDTATVVPIEIFDKASRRGCICVRDELPLWLRRP